MCSFHKLAKKRGERTHKSIVICGSSTEHLDKMVPNKESFKCLFTGRFMCDLCALCFHSQQNPGQEPLTGVIILGHVGSQS